MTAVFCGLALLAACSKSVSVGGAKSAGSEPDRPLRVEPPACNVAKASSTEDGNGDGRPDVFNVSSGSCKAVDLNFDGKIDRYVYLDGGGVVRRIENDFDRDGRLDEVQHFRGGELFRKDREMNLDGKFDTWDYYEGGKVVRRERDTDADGKVDQWWTFPDAGNQACPVVASDRDGDGLADVGSEVDICKPQGDEPANILATSSAFGQKPPAPGASSSVAPPPASSSSAAPAASGGSK
ncbi:MAG: hypothetical protein IT374_02485 [Polyangiaceae bacterium]|nr:hypothetical protein [Polyangiaceae bacterium]